MKFSLSATFALLSMIAASVIAAPASIENGRSLANIGVAVSTGSNLVKKDSQGCPAPAPAPSDTSPDNDVPSSAGDGLVAPIGDDNGGGNSLNINL